jgi:uncharacterized protein YfbU (UPF0304 family)
MGKVYQNGKNIPKWEKYTKMGEIYQNGKKYTKMATDIPK